MVVALEATIEGETQLSRRLTGLATDLDDFSPAFDAIQVELLHSIDENYESRGGLFGTWPARKVDAPWPLLEKTGEMRGGFKGEIFHDYLEISNPVPWFPYHQSNQPRQRLPRRVMMAIDNQRKEFIQKAFQAAIINYMNKGPF